MTEGSVIIMLCKCTNIRNQSGRTMSTLLHNGRVFSGEMQQASSPETDQRIDASEAYILRADREGKLKG